ncbi:hypothetical protein BT63DRAFT_442312 [Microthyrium microscopicum]|uniref:Uncharacterized protein n=1 Tax=Microthyrium microscopicum TaxID=703497 RepID=A0A6A6U110_9PEZI|nr:hypothetical protein BT63DRAFT_442312 [Microthyrium microscopicum]
MIETRARPTLADESSSNARTLSHGRGGAGNMGKDRRPSAGVKDLETPTIKSEKYTTGRGGSGNIAKNDKTRPEVARAAQDVEIAATTKPEANFHIGRGGAANVASLSEQEKQKAKDSNKRRSTEIEREVKKGVNTVLEKVGLKK